MKKETNIRKILKLNQNMKKTKMRKILNQNDNMRKVNIKKNLESKKRKLQQDAQKEQNIFK